MSQFEEDIPPGVDFLSEDAARKWTEQAKENVVGFVVGWSLIAGSWRMAAYAREASAETRFAAIDSSHIPKRVKMCDGMCSA